MSAVNKQKWKQKLKKVKKCQNPRNPSTPNNTMLLEDCNDKKSCAPSMDKWHDFYCCQDQLQAIVQGKCDRCEFLTYVMKWQNDTQWQICKTCFAASHTCEFCNRRFQLSPQWKNIDEHIYSDQPLSKWPHELRSRVFPIPPFVSKTH
jgi:hypothetical protein